MFLAGLATFAQIYCVQPLLPLLADDFRVGVAQSSLALSVTTSCLAVSILCAGALSETVGRRGLMFGSMALAAVWNLVAALAPSWPVLLLARGMEGLALGGVPAVALAYLAEEVVPRGLGRSVGLYIGGTAFGGMAGRLGVSALSDLRSCRFALVVVSVLGLLAAVGFIALLPPSRNFARRHATAAVSHLAAWRAHLENRALLPLFLIGGLSMGALVTIYNYVGFRLRAPPFNLSPTQIGLIFSAYLLGIVASIAAGALADRIGRRPVLAGGIAIGAAGVLLTWPGSLPSIIGGVALVTVGFFVAHSVASAGVGQLAQGGKGHASSLYLLTYYIGSSVLGSLGGWFWERAGWGGVAGFALSLLLLALLLALAPRKSPAPDPR